MKRIYSFIIALIMLLSLCLSINVSAEETDNSCLNEAVTGVNIERESGTVIVYTSAYGKTTGTSGRGYEIAVDATGNVIKADDGGNMEIPEDGYVISAGGTKKGTFSSYKVGDKAFYDSEQQTVTLVAAEYSPFKSFVFEYDGVNTTRKENTLIIYRDKATSETNTWGYEVCVNADGMVTLVGGNNNVIPEGGFVISAIGVKKQPLIDACELGMAAIIDEEAKTVTVSFEKENAAESYNLRLEELNKINSELCDTYLDIDYDSATAAINTLGEINNKIKTALENDNIIEFLAYGYAFDAIEAEFETAIIPKIPVEARTIWLRISTSNSNEIVEKTVKEIYDLGFNSVCIEILFDSTTIMPMPESSLFEQNPAFKDVDMLKLYIDEFHKYDIEVHAWMSCYRVGHEGSGNVSRSVAYKKPEWRNVDQNGETKVSNEYGDAYFLNPALPDVKEFLLETYRYILENYAIDGFQLDYVRYPENSTVNFGYDEYTTSEFLKKHAYSKVPTSSAQNGWGDWCEFRAAYVTDLVKATGELIKEIRPDVLFSCDVAPGYAESKTKMCQDTETWLKEGLVDIIYPMAYGTTDAVEKWANNTVGLAGDHIYTIMGLRDNGGEIYLEQILKSRECNADGTAFFSYSQYVANDYMGFIETSVFADKALNPTYNSKAAIVAQFDYISETIKERILPSLSVSSLSFDAKLYSDIETYAAMLDGVSDNLKNSTVTAESEAIKNAIEEGNRLVTLCDSQDEGQGKAVAVFLESALRVANKSLINSKDTEKDAYRAEHPVINEESSGAETEENSEGETDSQGEESLINKIFQIFFIVVMTIGIVGLPAYYYLNARRKRLVAESDSDSNNDEENESETEDNNE